MGIDYGKVIPKRYRFYHRETGVKMKLHTNLPKDSIESINFINGIDGESGWFIYLNNGWSFDPMANDTCYFISVDTKHEAKTLSVYKVEA